MDTRHMIHERGNTLTVGTHDGGTPRDAHHTMNEDLATAPQGCLNKETRAGQVDKEILVLGILHRNDHGVGLRIKGMFCADR